MRTLWPPTYDEISIRVWAAAGSLLVNLVLGLLICFRLAGIGVAIFSFPALFAYILVYTIVNHGIEVDTVSWLGVIIAAVINFGFYYLIFWWLISAFQPAKSWWPEKRI